MPIIDLIFYSFLWYLWFCSFVSILDLKNKTWSKLPFFELPAPDTLKVEWRVRWVQGRGQDSDLYWSPPQALRTKAYTNQKSSRSCNGKWGIPWVYQSCSQISWKALNAHLLFCQPCVISSKIYNDLPLFVDRFAQHMNSPATSKEPCSPRLVEPWLPIQHQHSQSRCYKRQKDN